MESATVFNEIGNDGRFNISVPCARSLSDEIFIIGKRNKAKHGEDINECRNSAHAFRSSSTISIFGRRIRYRSGRFGFERSLPENPALMNALLNAGIKRAVNMKAARENPTEACRGWPSLLKISAPETTSPAIVAPEAKSEEDIVRRSFSNWMRCIIACCISPSRSYYFHSFKFSLPWPETSDCNSPKNDTFSARTSIWTSIS